MVDLFSDEIFGVYGQGIHYGISDQEYHSIKAVSNSSLKTAKRSMRHFKQWLESEKSKQTAPMRWGTIYHMAVLQNEEFKKKAVLTEAADKRSKEYKDAVKENPDKYVLTAPEVEQLTDMVTELQNTPPCIRLIQNGAPEVTVFTEDKETGLRVKARIDWVSTDEDRPYILDLKTTTNGKPTELIDGSMRVRPSDFERHAYNLGYCNQAAFYLDIARQMNMNAEFFALIVQETDAPYLACSYAYGIETLDAAREENRKTLNRIAQCAKSGHWPGYSDKTEIIARPYWGLNDE